MFNAFIKFYKSVCYHWHVNKLLSQLANHETQTAVSDLTVISLLTAFLQSQSPCSVDVLQGGVEKVSQPLWGLHAHPLHQRECKGYDDSLLG